MTDTEGQAPAAAAPGDPNAPPLPPSNPTSLSMAEMAAAVPANIIPAALPHPVTQGPPIARGISYEHHFVVTLISDGRRLWDAASAEGKKLIAELRGETTQAADAIEAHKAGT